MKGFTLFCSILAVLAAGASALMFWLVGDQKDRLQRELATTRTELAQLRQKSADLAADRDGLAARAAAADQELSDLKARNISLEARNSQLAREVTTVREQITLRERTERASADESAELRRQLIEARAAAATTPKGATAEAAAAYEARIADLEGEIARLRHDAGEAPDPAARVPADLTGTVVDVGPRSAFVVLNIGSRNGAVPALEMVLRRGSVVIARVRLTDVRDDYSVAHVVPSSRTVSIRTGDTASRS